MTIKERINLFIESQNISRSAFERAAGLSYGYIAAMRKGFGHEKLDNVLRAFPMLNRDWLLYGEGEMLTQKPTECLTGEQIQKIGNNSPNSGNNSNNRSSDAVIEKALDEIAAQRRVTEKAQNLLQEAQSTIREMTATNSQLTAQLLALFQTIKPQTT